MDFPSNSNNPLGDPKQPKMPKEEKPPVDKDIQTVVSTPAVQRKTPLGRRFKSIFFRGEFKGAAKYVVSDVLLPALKNMFVDATSRGAERIVYGESAPRRRSELGRPRFSYNNPVDRGYRSPRGMLPDQPPIPRRRQDIGEIILVSRADAEAVVERLTDIIDKFDVASVADLHELVELPSTYIDNKWGWSALRGVDIRQIREGYVIDLPPVEPL